MNLKLFLKKLKDRVGTQTDKAKGHALVLANIAIIVLQIVYIQLRFKYINDYIPLWQTQQWGEAMLAPKIYLYLIPFLSAVTLFIGLFFEFLFRKYFVRFLKEVVLTLCTVNTILLTISVLRTIFVASQPFPPIINPLIVSLLVPFVFAFTTTFITAPLFINFAVSRDIVTNPKVHEHPGMLLQSPSARGGGVLYTLVFLGSAIMFVGITAKLAGLYVAIFMLGVLGYADDYQNTHPKSPFRALENPLLRLLLMSSAVAVVVLSGVIIKTVGNSLGIFFDLTQLKINALTLGLLGSYVFTLLWIVWLLNLLSWSNGIDGQYSGIVGIVSVFLCILALRFFPLLVIHKQVAILAAISAGIAFGLAKHTWYPSSILWGFGATSAGLVISALAILINTKILVSILILLIPFLDASVIFVRRLLQRKSPFKNDRSHFHHLLLDMGWSVPQIAKLYWSTTFLFGLIGLFSSERYLVQTVLIVGGLVASIIVLANVKALKKHPS